MPVAVKVRVEGVKEIVRALERITPRKNRKWVGRALEKAALLVQQIAAEKKIRRGGQERVQRRTPRGRFRTGTRVVTNPPVPGILTSRTGVLRRSIAVDRSGVPFFVETGTELIYGAVHELGLAGFPERPFLQPGLDDASKRFPDIFLREWERELPA